jgi:hypothetical protein
MDPHWFGYLDPISHGYERWIQIRIEIKSWIRIRIRIETNGDPQHWCFATKCQLRNRIQDIRPRKLGLGYDQIRIYYTVNVSRDFTPYHLTVFLKNFIVSNFVATGKRLGTVPGTYLIELLWYLNFPQLFPVLLFRIRMLLDL